MSRHLKANDDNGFGEWGGYMDAKIQKLEEQFATNAAHNPYKKSDLFAGIAIFVNGLTNPSADELKRIMMTHGGVYHTYYRSGVTTYIIAENLPDVKIRHLRSSRTIIRADWVVECVREMRILDYSNYLLYTDSTSRDQPKLSFGCAKKETEIARKVTPIIKANEPASPVPATAAVNRSGNNYVEDYDDDMFAEDNSEEEFSPAVCVRIPQTNPEHKQENIVNKSFNIAANLDFLNVKLRKHPSNPNLPPAAELTPATKVDTPIAVPKPLTSNQSSKSVRTAVDPNFLAEFYSNSRLHHIATLGANFKNHISQLRASSDLVHFPARQTLVVDNTRTEEVTTANMMTTSTIMHIDMDCFFVSVGLRSRPHLRGRPVAVTHSKNGAVAHVRPGADPQREREMWAQRHRRNCQTENRVETKTLALPLETCDSLAEIASCSYEARASGLKNGMFVGPALKLCPDLCTIPYDFDGYKEVAQQLYDTVAKYTLDIEAVSCDEMYVELSAILQSTGLSAEEFVKRLRQEIQTLTGCPCSAGIGSNRLQARMATKKAKPNGQYWLHTDNVSEYFANIELSQLPGIGYSAQQKLNQLGWRMCCDLFDIAVGRLQTEFGRKLGETLYQSCRGIDAKPLVYGQQRKSVSAEVNYGIRFSVDAEFETFLRQLCAEVHSRLSEIRHRGKSITLKLMVRAADAPVETAKFLGHGVCDNVTKTTTLADFTGDPELIERTVMAIKRSINVQPEEIRGVGIQIGKLTPLNEKSLAEGENLLKSMFAKVKPRREKPALETISATTVVLPENKVPPAKRTLRSKRSFSLDVPTTRKRAAKKKTKSNPIKDSVGNMAPECSAATDLQIGLDLAVLAELPDGIREEALRDFRRQNRPPPQLMLPPPIESGLDSEFLLALPEDIRKEVIENEKRDRMLLSKRRSADAKLEPRKLEMKPTNLHENVVTEQVPVDNVLLQSNWRDSLKRWIDSVPDGEASTPAQCDVDVITEYACELIRLRKLGDLYLRLRYLFRIINEKDCVWHRVYREIVSVLQVQMRSVFGANLHVNESFLCKSCATELV